MKLLSLCVLLALAAAIKANKEMLMPIINQCKGTVGASDDEVAQMMATTMAETPKQKCMFSCIMGAVEVVRFQFFDDDKRFLTKTFLKKIKGGKLQKEGTMTLAKMMSDGSPQKMKDAEDIFNECSLINDPDDCEAANKIGICLKTVGVKKGMVIAF